MTHVGTGEIKTARLTLRRFRVEDAESMYENWASDAEVVKYLTWPVHPNSGVTKMILESWTKLYEKDDYYQWAIVLNENGDRPIGSIAVVSLRDEVEKAEIGYCIGRKWWHKGIMTEALNAVIDYLFKEAGMNRIEARHDPRNPHSGGVMKKCGMTYEGTQRASDVNNQGRCDVSWYAILASDRENA
ncbi:MAG: GNAT family N-acetyltransferase [Clostridia bacterium]|nr:GNAT family N-acetyltransferase [Clostridia bacterium]